MIPDWISPMGLWPVILEPNEFSQCQPLQNDSQLCESYGKWQHDTATKWKFVFIINLIEGESQPRSLPSNRLKGTPHHYKMKAGFYHEVTGDTGGEHSTWASIISSILTLSSRECISTHSATVSSRSSTQSLVNWKKKLIQVRAVTSAITSNLIPHMAHSSSHNLMTLCDNQITAADWHLSIHVLIVLMTFLCGQQSVP